jgi:hypothetical protein
MFPNMFSISFIPYGLANVVVLSPIWLVQRGSLNFKIKPFALGSVQSSLFLSHWPIKLALSKKKKIELGRHLIYL